LRGAADGRPEGDPARVTFLHAQQWVAKARAAVASGEEERGAYYAQNERKCV
jgi:hypothetical protein